MDGDLPLRRGGSEMIGATTVKNVGKSPILIESIEPQANSSALQVTKARIWYLGKDQKIGSRTVFLLPFASHGWPPRHVPDDGQTPHPNYLRLPTARTIPPGCEAQLVYGFLLRADPSPKLQITALRITFKQDGRTIVWTLPETIRVYPPGHPPTGP